MGGGAHRYQISVSTSSFATGLRLVAETDHLMIAPAQLQPVIAEAGLVLRWRRAAALEPDDRHRRALVQ